MNTTQKQKNLILTLIALCSIYILSIGLFYKKSQNELSEKSHAILLEVIDTDMNKRLTNSHMPYHYFYVPQDTTTQIAIQREGQPTVYKEKTDSIKQLSLTEKQNHVFQSVLLHENPIHVNTLDSLLQAELHKKEIKAQTTILYTDNMEDKTYYSNPDSLYYTHFSAFPPINLGIEEEITLQAFLSISFISIIRHAALPIGGITLVCLTIIGVLLYLLLKKEQEPQMEIIPTKHPDTIKYKITEDILLDIDKGLIIYHSTEFQLTLQIKLFLKILLQSPDSFATYDMLITELYGDIGNVGKKKT